MGEVRVDGSEAPRVQSAEEMAGRFQAELMVALPDWQRRIVDHPAGLEQLERDVHAVFARGADLLIAGLLARVMKLPDFETGAKQTRKSYRFPLRRGSQREIRVRLLGGLMIWISSLYCAPRKKEGDPTDENIPGLYLELAQFGFGKNCSPGLESRVARQAITLN